ncbi:MAG: M18 family aminopeptidase, partial [Muribaculaceae bacterium]|nr:M18 family aminopeptidase [Muribaculaceae bacterium]
MMSRIENLLGWLDESTCNFRAIETMRRELETAGFTELRQADRWDVTPGSRHYIVKNDSAIIAFIAGTGIPGDCGFRIISAHSDSPCLKLKPNCEIYGDGGVVSLNVEKYGGGILYTWFDRPLSMSGRVMVDSGNPLTPETIIFDLDRPVATIPHLAIHFNRGVNEGNTLSVQKDMKPVLGYYSKEEIRAAMSKGGFVKMMVAERIGINPLDIIDYEICLYPFEKASLCGVEDEYFQSGRIDDLSMAYAGLEALLATAGEICPDTRVLAVFDNEETGSGTKQGAHSPV